MFFSDIILFRKDLTPNRSTPLKILLVDDSNTMRRIQANTLKSIGYEDVVQAADGKEAIDALRANPDVSLVLMDWNMPNMTGIEALRAIKADADLKAKPVIMVTSESEKSRIVEAVQAGAANYVVKPFDVDTLQEKILATVK